MTRTHWIVLFLLVGCCLVFLGVYSQPDLQSLKQAAVREENRRVTRYSAEGQSAGETEAITRGVFLAGEFAFSSDFAPGVLTQDDAWDLDVSWGQREGAGFCCAFTDDQVRWGIYSPSRGMPSLGPSCVPSGALLVLPRPASEYAKVECTFAAIPMRVSATLKPETESFINRHSDVLERFWKGLGTTEETVISLPDLPTQIASSEGTIEVPKLMVMKKERSQVSVLGFAYYDLDSKRYILEDAPPRRRTVYGTVRNRQSEPVPGAVVEVSVARSGASARLKTDSRGYFELGDALDVQGAFRVKTSARGYIENLIGSVRDQFDLAVEIEIVLESRAVIAGRVVDQLEEGIENLQVRISRIDQPPQETRTDVAGTFRFENASSGVWRLETNRSGSGLLGAVLPPPIEVLGGNKDIVLVATVPIGPPVRLHVTVIEGVDRLPFGDSKAVLIKDGPGKKQGFELELKRGIGSIDLPEGGLWRLFLRSIASTPRDVVFEEGETNKNVTIWLGESGEIRGRIVLPPGLELPEPIRVATLPHAVGEAVGSSPSQVGNLWIRDLENPFFVFKNIPPNYEVTIAATSGSYFGSSSVVEIASGQTADVQVVLKRARAVRVKGIGHKYSAMETRLSVSEDGLTWKRWTIHGIQQDPQEPIFVVPEEFLFWRMEEIQPGQVAWKLRLSGQFEKGVEESCVISLDEK